MLRNSKFRTLLWYGGVGLLLIFAVAVSLFRIYFSSVEEYREQLQELAGDYLGQPVTINRMDARVVGLSPTVILLDVSLLHQDGEQLRVLLNHSHEPRAVSLPATARDLLDETEGQETELEPIGVRWLKVP